MDTLIRRVELQTACVLLPLAALSLFQYDWRMPVSLIMGGLIGAANLRGIVWGATALLGTDKARGKLMFLSFFRMLIIFSVLVVLAALKAIDVYGLLVGFTVSLVIIVKEGLGKALRERNAGGEG